MLILFFSFVSTCFFAESFTTSQLDFLNQIFEFRINLRTYKTSDECIKSFDDFENHIYSLSEYQNGSEEFCLTVENLLVNAKYNCLYEKNLHDENAKKLILSQYEKTSAFNENNKNYNFIYACSSYDVINNSMQFLAQTKAIKYGLDEKRDYDNFISQNIEDGNLYMSAALWYKFAPAIGGGSFSTAKKYLFKAKEIAKNTYEKYYITIHCSQICFEEKNYDDAKKYLLEAEEILPNTRYIKYVEKLNENGISLFYYINNREKVEKKIGLKESDL